MFCKNCGNKINDNYRFCNVCGAEIVNSINQDIPKPQNNQSKPISKVNMVTPDKSGSVQKQKSVSDKKSNKKWVVISLISAAVAVIAVVAAIILLNGGLFDKSDSKAKKAAYLNEIENYIDDTNDTISKYYLTTEQENQINNLINKIEESVSAKKINKEKIEEYQNSIDSLLGLIEEENRTNLENLKQDINVDEPANLFDDELANVEEYASEYDEAMSDGNYIYAMDVLDEWQDYVERLNNPANELRVSVEQYDISELPKVKLYLSVENEDGTFLNGLNKDAFYVNEQRTINGEFKRQTLINVGQLNEKEGISIGLVADVSGSMSDSLDEVKLGIREFIASVQFDNGDVIEVIRFNENIYVASGFTDSQSQLYETLNDMYANGSTRLYDALISEIERVRSCANAKCVIAFTDGYDNASNHTYQDVINYAGKYNIPVFLIGIGNDCDASTLRKIAEQTGGFYEGIYDSSSLEEVYNKIYKAEKEVYVLEYETENADDYESDYNLDVYVRSDDNSRGNTEGFNFEPEEFFDVLYNRFLIAGVDCQYKGERNLLDSGLIITSEEAYKNKDCVAYQSQESINTGGVGTTRSDIFMILVDYGVLNIHKDGNGYVVYGFCDYNISKVKSYGSISNEKERAKIREIYGNNISDDTMFWIELNITNYERLTVIKDTDGKWKINTRVYEREGGGDTYVVNEIYSVKKQ